MPDKYANIQLPAKETEAAYRCFQNVMEDKNLTTTQRFFFIFSFFYSLGKYNKDPISPDMEQIIAVGLKESEKTSTLERAVLKHTSENMKDIGK